MLHIATTGSGNAAVKAELAILARHAPGWVQQGKFPADDHGKGLTAILKIVADAKRQDDQGDAELDSWPVHFPN